MSKLKYIWMVSHQPSNCIANFASYQKLILLKICIKIANSLLFEISIINNQVQIYTNNFSSHSKHL